MALSYSVSGTTIFGINLEGMRMVSSLVGSEVRVQAHVSSTLTPSAADRSHYAEDTL